MRNGQNSRRNRGRGSRGMPMGGGGGQQGNRSDARVRGNAHQLHEKYKNLSRDAAAAGDRILAEYYMQHADHYFRVLSEMRPADRPRDDQRRRDFPLDEAEGDDAELTVQPAGFGANAAASTFGVQAADEAADGGDDADGDEGGQAEASAPVVAADDEERAPPARGRGRPRGRPRRRAEAGDTPSSEG